MDLLNECKHSIVRIPGDNLPYCMQCGDKCVISRKCMTIYLDWARDGSTYAYFYDHRSITFGEKLSIYNKT